MHSPTPGSPPVGPLPPEQLRQAYRTALAVVVPNIEPASGEFEVFGLVARAREPYSWARMADEVLRACGFGRMVG